MSSSFSAQDYKFKANPEYYGGKPPVPELNFPAYSGNDSANLAMVQGEIDWTGQFIPNVDKVYTSKNPNNHYWFPPGNIFSLMPNLKDPILSQPVVRQAMSMAIDRNALSTKAEYGYEKPAQPYAVLPTSSSWVDPSLPEKDKKFTFNPTGAEALLEKAGYHKNASGVLESPNGTPLKFNLIVVSGWTDWDAEASMVAQDLKQIGIQVNVQQEQQGAYQSQLSSHKFQLALPASTGGPNPYYIDQALYSTKGGGNYEQFSNSSLDAALNAFAQTTDEAKQKQAMYQVERIVAEQLPTIPLVCGATWYEYNTSKYTGWPDANNAYVSPSLWSYPAAAIVVMHLKPVS